MCHCCNWTSLSWCHYGPWTVSQTANLPSTRGCCRRFYLIQLQWGNYRHWMPSFIVVWMVGMPCCVQITGDFWCFVVFKLCIPMWRSRWCAWCVLLWRHPFWASGWIRTRALWLWLLGNRWIHLCCASRWAADASITSLWGLIVMAGGCAERPCCYTKARASRLFGSQLQVGSGFGPVLRRLSWCRGSWDFAKRFHWWKLQRNQFSCQCGPYTSARRR